MLRNLAIAVTGLNSTDSPAPGMPVMRCIKEVASWEGVSIGFGYDSFDAGLYKEDYFEHAYLLPYPSEGADYLLDRLLKAHARTPFDVIIPTLDSELYNFISIEESLHKNGIMTFLPTKEQINDCSKENLFDLLNRADIETPATAIVRDFKKIGMAVEEVGFPLMVKGVFYEAYKTSSMVEVSELIDRLSRKWGLPIILQKYINGDEIDIAAVGNGEGGCVGSVPMRKLIITDKGKGWAGVTIKDEGLYQLLDRYFSFTKWRGPLELEILKEKTTGRYYLLEVNNRFPAWIYLSKAAGINLPWLTVQLAVGEKVETSRDYKTGIIFNRYTEELILDVKQLETMNIGGEIHHG